MSIFSSSWKYYAFAASSPLFESNDYPHTFQKVLMQGFAADDTFGNILAYTYRTDLTARARAMVNYATKPVDPYLRGLPSSDFRTFSVEVPWVGAAIERDVKAPPIEPFTWMRHGVFDVDFLVRQFILDHYLVMAYFPWPIPCLTPLANPRFNDGDTGWDKTSALIDVTARIGEITKTRGTLYNKVVGKVSPGETIHLRAVCDRGSNSLNGQAGSINLTFYDEDDTKISTASAVNHEGMAGEWQLLQLSAVAPPGTVTVRAWAGGFIPYDTDFYSFAIDGENPVTVQIFFNSLAMEYDHGKLPANRWLVYPPWTDVAMTGTGQYLLKVEIIERLSGDENSLRIGSGSGALGVWLDLWTYRFVQVSHADTSSGIPEEYVLNLAVAKNDGTGNPLAGSTVEFVYQVKALGGYKHLVMRDEFTDTTNKDLNLHPPTVLYNPWYGGNTARPWVNQYLTVDGISTAGKFIISANNARATVGTGAQKGALYVVDTKISNYSFAAEFNILSTAARAGSGGLVGRFVNSQNFWLVDMIQMDTANPVLRLIKIENGVATTVASTVLTGKGPLSLAAANYKQLRLEFRGDFITAACSINKELVTAAKMPAPVEVTYEDSTFSGSTKCGLYSNGNFALGIEWQRVTITPHEFQPFDIIVWDSSPVTSYVVNDHIADAFIYFPEGPNGKLSPPYHSSMLVEQTDSDDVIIEDVIHWKYTPFGDEFLLKYTNVTGDVDRLEVFYQNTSYGPKPNEWLNLFRLMILLQTEPDVIESLSATISVTIAIDDGTGNPKPGSESVAKIITLTAIGTGP